jgi:hypothetical protein
MITKCFKEWAVVCDALARGRQIVILRKGGILEAHKGFELEAREFLLYPTTLHQNPEGVIPEERPRLPTAQADRITHLARVADCRRVTDVEQLRKLRPLHIYSDALLEERFHRWQDAGVHALFVRVAELARPVAVPPEKDYAGCKSWFDLKFKVDERGARPVLSEDEFNARAV